MMTILWFSMISLILTWCCHCSCYGMGCFRRWYWCWCSICIWCCIRWEFCDVVIFEIDFFSIIKLDVLKKRDPLWKFSWSTVGCPGPAVKDPKSWVGNCVGIIGHHIRHARHMTCQLIIEKEHELSIWCSIIIQFETHFNFMPISSRYRSLN